MKLRLAQPTMLIDVGRLTELSYIRDAGDHLAIGALTRHRDIETSPVVAAGCPLLAHAASHVGDPQVRHRGTIGGSIAHSDPASDLPSVLLATGGSVVVRSASSGERVVPGAELFTGFLENSLEPTEMITEVRIPKAAGGWSFQKFNRRAQDWAIVGVSVARNGRTGVALVNMASTPVTAAAVEAAVASGASAAEAAELAAEGLEPPGDLNASPEYRIHLAKVLVRRALQQAGIA
jgi:carbon-monoxide dehydrogenase medium subunit